MAKSIKQRKEPKIINNGDLTLVRGYFNLRTDIPETTEKHNLTVIITHIKQTKVNGTDQYIDEVISDYTHIIFQKCLPMKDILT